MTSLSAKRPHQRIIVPDDRQKARCLDGMCRGQSIEVLQGRVQWEATYMGNNFLLGFGGQVENCDGRPGSLGSRGRCSLAAGCSRRHDTRDWGTRRSAGTGVRGAAARGWRYSSSQWVGSDASREPVAKPRRWRRRRRRRCDRTSRACDASRSDGCVRGSSYIRGRRRKTSLVQMLWKSATQAQSSQFETNLRRNKEGLVGTCTSY